MISFSIEVACWLLLIGIIFTAIFSVRYFVGGIVAWFVKPYWSYISGESTVRAEISQGNRVKKKVEKLKKES